jgi:alkanesulfonate monooxygenase SsuD/methylene tetrahydromethanopterin reductase-like flavin-dependent oxidoreductase (luciferase family)
VSARPPGRPAVGVTLPQFTGDAGPFVDGARRAESLGLDSVWVFDHLWPLSGGKRRPVLECWTALAWLAAATERIQVGTLVTRSSLRHPAVLAKMAATVAEIAPGRLVVAVGSGDEASRAENEAFGIPYHAGTDRVAQLEETVEVLARWRADDEVTLRGGFVTLDALPPSPPGAGFRLWVGGRSESAIDLAARRAEGWNAWGASPERFRAGAYRLARVAGARMVEATWGGLALIGGDDAGAAAKLGSRPPRLYLVGGPERIAAHIDSLADAGASHVVLTFPDSARPESFDLLARAVLPRLDARRARTSPRDG